MEATRGAPALLGATRSDIVCLPELKPPQDCFPGQAIAELGYEAAWLGYESWKGVALLRKIVRIEHHRGYQLRRCGDAAMRRCGDA